MARLSHLIPGMAEALKLAEGRVRNAASILRLGKLLTTGPRGPAAPHMTPTDTTNLLLALMYDDDQENAVRNVPRLREAVLSSFGGRLKSTGEMFAKKRKWRAPEVMPPHAFITDGTRLLQLGEAVDSIIARLAAGVDLHDPEAGARSPSPVVNDIALSISRPGYAARIHVDSPDAEWTFAFTWFEPGAEDERAAQIARGEEPTPYGESGTRLHSTRSVETPELRAIAAILALLDE